VSGYVPGFNVESQRCHARADWNGGLRLLLLYQIFDSLCKVALLKGRNIGCSYFLVVDRDSFRAECGKRSSWTAGFELGFWLPPRFLVLEPRIRLRRLIQIWLTFSDVIWPGSSSKHWHVQNVSPFVTTVVSVSRTALEVRLELPRRLLSVQTEITVWHSVGFN
jgi:hypothetical protein